MTLDATALFAAAESHCMASGLFETVNGHEPKNTPGHGLTAAVWVQSIRPIQASGLDQTSARVELRNRIYTDMLQEPQDAIDPAVIAATDVLMAAYSADFTFGGLIKNVDLLGAHGEPFSAQAGYLNHSGALYRVMDILLPCICNDLWAQAP